MLGGRTCAMVIGSGHNSRITAAYPAEPEVLPEKMFGRRQVP